MVRWSGRFQSKSKRLSSRWHEIRLKLPPLCFACSDQRQDGSGRSSVSVGFGPLGVPAEEGVYPPMNELHDYVIKMSKDAPTPARDRPSLRLPFLPKHSGMGQKNRFANPLAGRLWTRWARAVRRRTLAHSAGREKCVDVESPRALINDGRRSPTLHQSPLCSSRDLFE